MQGPLIVFIAALPPPMHGQSLVTARLAKDFSRLASRLVVIDTSPRTLTRSTSYHFIRILRHLVALFSVFRWSMRRDKCLYTVVESGAGIVYNFAILTVARVFGYRLFLHHHTARHLKEESRFVGLLLRLAGSEATHITLSGQMAADLTRIYPAVKSTLTLHNSRNICPSFANRSVGAKSLRMRLGLLSNLSLQKGLDTAIETCLSLAKAGFPVQLTLAGPMADRTAKETYERVSKYPDLFKYVGPLDGQAKARFYDDLDVFLFPTRYPHEAQPLVVLEAMAAGVPVIAANRGYIAELLGDCGKLVSGSDEFAVVAFEQLKNWYEDDLLYQAASAESRDRFDALLKRSEDEFEELLGKMNAPNTGNGDLNA